MHENRMLVIAPSRAGCSVCDEFVLAPPPKRYRYGHNTNDMNNEQFRQLILQAESGKSQGNGDAAKSPSRYDKQGFL